MHTLLKVAYEFNQWNSGAPGVLSVWMDGRLKGYENGEDQTQWRALCTGAQPVKSLNYTKVKPLPNPPYAIRVFPITLGII